MNPKMSDIYDVHQKEYGTPPVLVASAPGRANLAGDFTEYSQGLILGFALESRVYVAVSPREDGAVRFFSREYNERKKTTSSNLKFRKEDRWANYPKGALAVIHSLGVSIGGLDITVCGDVPQSIGLGSSQALTLASLYAFNQLYDGGQTPHQLISLAHNTEITFLNQNSGVSGFFMLTYSMPQKILGFDCRSMEYQSLGWNWNEGELFLINTKVPSSSFSTMQQDRIDCDRCLKVLAGGKPGKSLRDFTKADLKERVGDIPESARRRALHVVDETLRVQDCMEAIRSQDFSILGRIMNRSHESLKDLYEVSCPEVDWLVRRLQETEGVLGARMTGDGNGGCVVVLARNGALVNFKHNLEEYERIFGFKAEVIPVAPSGNASIHREDEA